MVTAGIRDYLEANIIPRYQFFDQAHLEDHVCAVIENALIIAGDFDVNIDMVLVAAAYHDVGLEQGRADHELFSGLVLENDSELKKWFGNEEIIVMKEACEDHRASRKSEPRSLYGKIIADADRILDPDIILTRALQYGAVNYPVLDFDGQIERVLQHVNDKYGENGYMTLWLDTPVNLGRLDAIRAMLLSKEKVKMRCEQLLRSLRT